MTKKTRIVLLPFLRKLKMLLRNEDCDVPGISTRELNRWLKGEVPPTGELVRLIARAVWDLIHSPGRRELRNTVFAAIRELAPETPAEWNKTLFVAWLVEQAEDVRARLPHKPRKKRQPAPQESSSVPLTATLELLVRDPATGHFTSAAEKPSLLPVKQGDEVQLRAHLSRLAYVCLAWVDQQGQAFSMYPWPEPDWKGTPLFQLRQEATVPERLSSVGHSDLIATGPPGVETLVLMASLEVPSKDTLKGVREQLSVRRLALKPSELRGPVISMCMNTPLVVLPANGSRTPARRKSKDPVEALPRMANLLWLSYHV